MEIPDDDNGRVLRRFIESGDDLTKPRIVEFFHIFPSRTQALGFAADCPEKEYTIEISYFEERDCWDVTVSRFTRPTHSEVTRIEADFAARAEAHGGAADGWQAQALRKNERRIGSPWLTER